MSFGFQSIQNNSLSLMANRNLAKSERATSSALERLSSGLRVNTAKDRPASLVISEQLRAQLDGMSRAIRNTQEATNVLGIAEGGLTGIQDQLRSLRGLALHSLNSGITSPQQTSANQAEMNGALNAIGRIASSTRFSDQFLLNGAQQVTFSADDPDSLLDVGATRIDAYSDDMRSANIAFSGEVEDQAQKAVLEVDGGGSTTLAEAQSFTLTGSTGATQTFSFSAGASFEEMAEVINARADETGVQAYAINDAGSGATGLRLASAEYGSSQSLRLTQTDGSLFAPTGNTATASGQDAVLTIDGQRVTGDGLTFQVDTGRMTGTLAFREGSPAATTIAQTGYDQDTLTDADTARAVSLGEIKGGMQLQLGEGAGSQTRTHAGIQGAGLSDLGRVTVEGKTYSMADLMSGGAASLASNPELAMRVIDQAIADVSMQRAQIGSLQANMLQANENNLNVAIENITATESGIRDADMAFEIAELTKSQILMQAGILGIQSVNANSDHFLQLLGG